MDSNMSFKKSEKQANFYLFLPLKRHSKNIYVVNVSRIHLLNPSNTCQFSYVLLHTHTHTHTPYHSPTKEKYDVHCEKKGN